MGAGTGAVGDAAESDRPEAGEKRGDWRILVVREGDGVKKLILIMLIRMTTMTMLTTHGDDGDDDEDAREREKILRRWCSRERKDIILLLKK